MYGRSQLLLLSSTYRTPLRLIVELDQRLRALERLAKANPHDAELQQKAGHAKKQAGPPDQKHNWRFNGKGWFTRPQWNGGRCPPESQPTKHNTCIGDKDKDKQHYMDVGNRSKVQARPDASPDEVERTQARQVRAARGEMVRTSGVVNSPLAVKPGNKVNWEHPHEPKIYLPYENDKPRPLPDSPEHLGSSFSTDRSGRAGSWRHREHAREMDRISKHYTDKGFDPKYVKNTLSSTRGEPSIDWDSLSDADLERLPPDRMSRVRALRKKGVKDEKAREAEHLAYIDQHPEWDGHDHYDAYDDYDYDDYDDHDWEERPSTIGGYENHPGYPGHPDYPQFDGRPAEVERPDHGRERERESYSDEWARRRELGKQRHHPLKRTPLKINRQPPGGQEPSWPRTGERQDTHNDESPDQFESPGSGRKRGSNRTSGRSYMGGGRGRTNFRRRGGRRQVSA